MKLEHVVQHDRTISQATERSTPERRRPRAGIALAIGAFMGIAAAMLVAATTNNAVAAAIVMGISVLAAIGSVLARE